MELAINRHGLFPLTCCPNDGIKHVAISIPTIWVESPRLTAAYYREYLGFKIILRNPFIRNSTILIYKNRNLVRIKAIDSHKPINSQRLTLYLQRIDIEYSQLCKKVWVIRPLINNDFLVKDCNGIVIVYCTN